jgi:hypothetical protein
MHVLKDMAETCRRLEINRELDLQRLQNDLTKGFDTLRASKRSSLIRNDDSEVAGHSLPLWNSGNNIQGSSMDNLFLYLGTQAHEAQIYNTERKVIEKLIFQGMLDRQFEIKEAHLATFEWIFSCEQRPSPVHFTEWLRSGDGIFWVSGRPGSGKSTLMKFVVGDSRTAGLLSEWAGNSKLVSASFFFWAAGARMQKSIEGLLQSLVCQILKQCPSLISAAFPSRTKDGFIKSGNPEYTWVNPDKKELINAIGSITRATELDAKFCFFIDGLDEYEGFDREIAATISNLASSPSVKICVASRPHNIFVSAFGGTSELMFYVHEFTDLDIRQYIKDVLEDNPAFLSQKLQDPEEYQELAEYIRKEAHGVFLWVYLVVLNILDGIENADRMSDLKRKLKKVPTDLKSLFTHILNSVEPDYHEQQAQMLQIACQAEEPLNPIAYSFLDEDDLNFAIDCPVKPMPHDLLSHRCEDMKKRVVARCKLLLEVGQRPGADLYFAQSVMFLHRSVWDYLRESEVQNLLDSRRTNSFDARRRVCDALLAQIKCVPTSSCFERDETGHSLVLQLLRQARDIERLENISVTSHLDSLKSTINGLLGSDFHWWQSVPSFFSRKTCFLSLMIEHGLSIYLEARLAMSADESSFTAIEKACLLTTSLVSSVESQPFGANMVEILLKHGADPNLSYMGDNIPSPWAMYLHRLDFVTPRVVDLDVDKQRFLIFEQLIKGGAGLGPSYFNSKRIDEKIIQNSVLADNAKHILALIKEQRSKKQKDSGFRSWFRWK